MDAQRNQADPIAAADPNRGTHAGQGRPMEPAGKPRARRLGELAETLGKMPGAHRVVTCKWWMWVGVTCFRAVGGGAARFVVVFPAESAKRPIKGYFAQYVETV
jgi:hypothetical protein